MLRQWHGNKYGDTTCQYVEESPMWQNVICAEVQIMRGR